MYEGKDERLSGIDDVLRGVVDVATEAVAAAEFQTFISALDKEGQKVILRTGCHVAEVLRHSRGHKSNLKNYAMGQILLPNSAIVLSDSVEVASANGLSDSDSRFYFGDSRYFIGARTIANVLRDRAGLAIRSKAVASSIAVQSVKKIVPLF